ncbi:hypothetical protein QFC20_007405 [Naganishia adeliensis]|uniref:Uncharacterized protein n=1 Tax=Naganishia adeliensis TaxID=92952 RepID=A0ACC2V071_9TREE|nr:hypothetical protein QFC20_007405 [Naganishia adeliensis]
MLDLLHFESFIPNHLLADPLAFSNILANDAATPGYEVSIVQDGTRMVWVKVTTLDEEMVFLRGASLLRNVTQFWE